MSARHACYHCGQFLPWALRPGTAWEACGEFGEDVRYVCPKCAGAPDFILQAGNGRRDAYCGFITEDEGR